jgi:hypothetical protein
LSPVATSFTPGISGPATTAQNNYESGAAAAPRSNFGPPARRVAQETASGTYSIGTFTYDDVAQRAIILESEFPLGDQVRRVLLVSFLPMAFVTVLTSCSGAWH